MSGGAFLTKWTFRCGYCRRIVKVGEQAIFIMNDNKKACSDCSDEVINRIQHGPYDKTYMVVDDL